MVFLVAQSGYSVERIADDLSLILEDHIDPGWRCNNWHLSGGDKDMLLVSVRGHCGWLFQPFQQKEQVNEHLSSN